MSTFSTLYKKTFKQLLYPQGYKIYKSIFYKEVNNACFFITARKEKDCACYNVFFNVLPYCYDLISDEFELEDPQDWMRFQLRSFIGILRPELLHQEYWEQYFETRLYADSDDEEGTLESLHNVCNDIDIFILPYFHRFQNLDYYYNQIIESYHYNEKDMELYNLSLKLHKYDNAMLYVEYKLSYYNKLIKNLKDNIKRLENYELDEVEKRLIKKKTDYVEVYIEIDKKMINDSEKEILELTKIKNAISKNNFKYLDDIVAETEEKSSKYIKVLLCVNL